MLPVREAKPTTPIIQRYNYSARVHTLHKSIIAMCKGAKQQRVTSGVQQKEV
jgi:hypothetical protein